jgi:hypothetical protein
LLKAQSFANWNTGRLATDKIVNVRSLELEDHKGPGVELAPIVRAVVAVFLVFEADRETEIIVERMFEGTRCVAPWAFDPVQLKQKSHTRNARLPFTLFGKHRFPVLADQSFNGPSSDFRSLVLLGFSLYWFGPL